MTVSWNCGQAGGPAARWQQINKPKCFCFDASMKWKRRFSKQRCAFRTNVWSLEWWVRVDHADELKNVKDACLCYLSTVFWKGSHRNESHTSTGLLQDLISFLPLTVWTDISKCVSVVRVWVWGQQYANSTAEFILQTVHVVYFVLELNLQKYKRHQLCFQLEREMQLKFKEFEG